MIRFPIWSYVKLGGVCWLVLPYFNGASYVYENFIRPMYRNPQVKLWYVPRSKDIFSKPDDVLFAAEKYIQENGPEAFERLIARVISLYIFLSFYVKNCWLGLFFFFNFL